MRAPITAAALAALLCFAGTTVWAQDLNSDQLIQSLKPKSAFGESKGLRAPRPMAQPDTSGTDTAASTASAAPTHRVPVVKRPVQAAAAENPSVSLTVEFRTGSAELTPSAMHTLDELGRALSSATLASYKFRIEGHTDTVGSKDLNQTLSEQRAETVVNYLETKFNVAPDRLQAVGMGEQGLAVPTGDQVAEPRNRRVQVVNVGV
jgi:OOP family OmpA-OmpF porin